MENLIQELSKIRDVSNRSALLKKKGLNKSEIESILNSVHIAVKGKLKFPRANFMKFSMDSLAQASSKEVSEYRTWKMREKLGIIKKSLDIGAGIGGDTIAMAMRWKVISVEKDSNTIDMLKHNISVYNLQQRVDFVCGDILKLLEDKSFIDMIGNVDCIFFDPSRRLGSHRTVKVEEYEPPLSLVEKLQEICPNICVKISPGVEFSYLKYDCDIEVLSLKGEVKEVILWFGKFKNHKDKKSILATKLPEKITITQIQPKPFIELDLPKKYIYEPDPAFIKAHLIEEIAQQYTLKKLNPNIAYLTSDRNIVTPVLKKYQVITYLDVNYENISKKLSEINIGKIDYKSRGIDIDLKNIHKQIKGKGKNKGLIIFTKVRAKNTAIICSYTT